MKFITPLLVTCLSTAAVADTTLTFVDKKNKEAMTMQFANNKMRTSSIGQKNSYAIYDGASSTFTIVNTKDKDYFVMDKETLESLGDMQAMMDKMLEKQLADMPEAQREMMRGMMSGILKKQMAKENVAPVYKFSGKHKSYNGFDCDVVIKKLKRKKSEFCVTDYHNVGMKSNEFAVIKSFQKIMQKLTKQFHKDSSMDFSMLGEYVPVKYNQMGDSGELKSVNHDHLDPSIFNVPSNYERMEMPW